MQGGHTCFVRYVETDHHVVRFRTNNRWHRIAVGINLRLVIFLDPARVTPPEMSESAETTQAWFAPHHPDDRTKDPHDPDCDQPGHECEHDSDRPADPSSEITVLEKMKEKTTSDPHPEECCRHRRRECGPPRLPPAEQ